LALTGRVSLFAEPGGRRWGVLAAFPKDEDRKLAPVLRVSFRSHLAPEGTSLKNLMISRLSRRRSFISRQKQPGRASGFAERKG
jgi:hypothetical protein